MAILFLQDSWPCDDAAPLPACPEFLLPVWCALAWPLAPLNVANLIGIVIFAPLVETLVLDWFLQVLKRASASTFFIAGTSAAVRGLLHATTSPVRFFGTAWSFFVFSCAYLAWEKRWRKQAFKAAAVPHALLNLTAVLVNWGYAAYEAH